MRGADAAVRARVHVLPQLQQHVHHGDLPLLQRHVEGLLARHQVAAEGVGACAERARTFKRRGSPPGHAIVAARARLRAACGPRQEGKGAAIRRKAVLAAARGPRHTGAHRSL